MVREARILDPGDAEEGFRQADVVLEEACKTHLDPAHDSGASRHGCVLERKKAYALGFSQKPLPFADRRCAGLNINVNQVRVLTPYIGGDFGDKGSMERQHIIAPSSQRRRTGQSRWNLHGKTITSRPITAIPRHGISNMAS